VKDFLLLLGRQAFATHGVLLLVGHDSKTTGHPFGRRAGTRPNQAGAAAPAGALFRGDSWEGVSEETGSIPTAQHHAGQTRGRRGERTGSDPPLHREGIIHCKGAVNRSVPWERSEQRKSSPRLIGPKGPEHVPLHTYKYTQTRPLRSQNSKNFPWRRPCPSVP
jgi:hypothetical protein